MIDFYLSFDKVPKTTHQQRKFNFKTRTSFEPASLRDARRIYMEQLKRYAPSVPFSGNIELTVHWYFETSIKKRHLKRKYTRPDLDNLNKLLQDCLCKCGFFSDDARVTDLNLKKFWSFDNPGIYIRVDVVED